ncbi:MAG: GIY-YIG nuclease family protein [Planctomycetales bacterium]|nr:GIY-YIG nuclease family protein [Planctomycetales bacterium]
MSMTPKTIQIFLPGGDPRGIRIAEITTRIVQVIEVPRSLLQDFIKMPESNQVALYFLFGEAEDGTELKVYVGQTGDLRARLLKHNRERDFWQRALILISRTNSLTQTHALFLEWYCLQATRKAGRYADENGNSGSKPHTPAPLEADCLEIFETGQALLATLGFPVFDAVSKPPTSPDAEDVLYCKASGADGRGLYTPEGFVVLKGSTGRKANMPSAVGTGHERFRNKLLESGVMRAEGEKVIFEKDHLFGSPSMAAISLTGRSTNGWNVWRDKDGKTLDELKRQSPDESP